MVFALLQAERYEIRRWFCNKSDNNLNTLIRSKNSVTSNKSNNASIPSTWANLYSFLALPTTPLHKQSKTVTISTLTSPPPLYSSGFSRSLSVCWPSLIPALRPTTGLCRSVYVLNACTNNSTPFNCLNWDWHTRLLEHIIAISLAAAALVASSSDVSNTYNHIWIAFSDSKIRFAELEFKIQRFCSSNA